MAFPPMSRSCSRQSARFQSLQELERLGTGEESTVETGGGTTHSNISLPGPNRLHDTPTSRQEFRNGSQSAMSSPGERPVDRTYLWQDLNGPGTP